MVWMGGLPFATTPAQVSHNETVRDTTTPRLIRHCHGSQSQSSILPSRTVTRHREESPSSVASHRSKRPRTTDNEKPPCLRCKILKKRVGFNSRLLDTLADHKFSAIHWNSVAIAQNKALTMKAIFGRCLAAIEAISASSLQ